jgi:hypothetical protein
MKTYRDDLVQLVKIVDGIVSTADPSSNAYTYWRGAKKAYECAIELYDSRELKRIENDLRDVG